MESDDQERWQATYDEMMKLVKARDHTGAITLLQAAFAAAIERGQREEAASYSGLLSTTFAIAGRDEESLESSQEAERLDPENVHHKLTTARILLSGLGRPADALTKALEAISLAPPDDPFRYAAVAVLGLTKLATGEIGDAVAAFRENTSPSVMARLRRAQYAGVYDLGLAIALIDAGVAPAECEAYLLEVREVAVSTGYGDHVIQSIDQLLGRISPAV